MSWLKWLYPGINIKRWIFLFALGTALVVLGFICLLRKYWHGLFDGFVFLVKQQLSSTYYHEIILALGVFLILAGIALSMLAIYGFSKSLIDIFLADSNQKVIDVIFSKRRLVKGASVAVIGGGTGLSNLLRGIKQITGNCTAIVACTDDGGSSGRLRSEFGTIPPGDLRNCIISLADTEPLMSKLMQYRFEGDNSLSGHSFGNLFIIAMSHIVGDIERGLNAVNKVLKVQGVVTPATVDSVDLVAYMADGSIVKGETSIVAAGKKIERLTLEPSHPAATQSAVKAILQADMLIVGPGSLYTSLITNLLIPEIAEAVKSSKAIKVYICNVMTQPGETDGYNTFDHVAAIYAHVGSYFFDYIVVNKQTVSQMLLDKYAEKGAYPVNNDNSAIMALGANIIEANLISEEDLVRHDPVKLAKTLIALMYRLRLSGKGLKLLDYYFVKDSLRKLKKVFEGE